MIESFIFLPVALAIGFLVFHFYFMVDSARGKNRKIEPKVGYWILVLGYVLLLIAYFVCSNYVISFDELDQANYLPKIIRHLLYAGFAFISMGIVIVVKSFFNDQNPSIATRSNL
jgi:hypothetical protein